VPCQLIVLPAQSSPLWLIRTTAVPGTLEGIRARVDVSYLGGYDWAWDGTYRFGRDDD
jgi:hypothetical protein